MNEIEQNWQEYRLKVIPLNASSLQVAESRRCYFAGAGAVVRHVQGLNLAVPVLTKELHEMRIDVEQFRAEVRAGRA